MNVNVKSVTVLGALMVTQMKWQCAPVVRIKSIAVGNVGIKTEPHVSNDNQFLSFLFGLNYSHL